MTAQLLPLTGRRIAITADRKGAELAASLERLGATVTWGPTMTAVAPERDSLLEVETRAMLAADPAWLAVSTGSGLRAWLQAAEGFKLRDEVEDLLGRTRTVARGSKSHGSLRALRIEPEFVSPKETMDDVCSWLSERLRPGDVLAAQVHGGEVIGTLDALRPRVRGVVTVAPYRWVLPDDPAPAQRVVEQIIAGEIDVIAETSAPSVRNLFVVADGMGMRAALLMALNTQVCVACVGSVTARAFEEVGVSVNLMPTRPRTADLIRSIVHWTTTRDGPASVESPADAQSASPALELVPGATAVRIGPTVIRLGRQEFAVLAALVRRPGVVIRPEDLALQAWGHRAPDDATRIRHHIGRIRRKLAAQATSIQTVRSIGYRYQPSADSDA
jgi:uroporphyrinogen-III synthase